MMFDVIYLELHKATDLVLWHLDEENRMLQGQGEPIINRFQLVSTRTIKSRNVIAGK